MVQAPTFVAQILEEANVVAKVVQAEDILEVVPSEAADRAANDVPEHRDPELRSSSHPPTTPMGVEAGSTTEGPRRDD